MEAWPPLDRPFGAVPVPPPLLALPPAAPFPPKDNRPVRTSGKSVFAMLGELERRLSLEPFQACPKSYRAASPPPATGKSEALFPVESNAEKLRRGDEDGETSAKDALGFRDGDANEV